MFKKKKQLVQTPKAFVKWFPSERIQFKKSALDEREAEEKGEKTYKN